MIILCGASASGKTLIASILEKDYGIKKVITHTTRPIRNNEKNNIDYHFVTKDEFLKLKEQSYFVETTLYNNNYYGCAKNEVRDNACVILEPEGVSNFLKLNNPNIVCIILLCNQEIRKERMMSRGDKEEDIIARIKKDQDRFNLDNLKFADYIIESDKLTPKAIADKIYNFYQNKINKI